MICPKCQLRQNDGLTECLRCGVVFAKLQKAAVQPPHPLPKIQDEDTESVFTWRDLFFPVPTDIQPTILVIKALLLLFLTVWGCRFIFSSVDSNVVGDSFMHLVNLVFHEAGHVIFSPLGKFIKTLGGSLGQLLMPAICIGVLLLRTRDAYGAAVALWWLAQSFMDIAPYINDARALKLILLGGVTGKDVEDYHDWEYILRKLGLLRMDHILAWTAQIIGIVLMLTAIGWATANLWMQWKAHQARVAPRK